MSPRARAQHGVALFTALALLVGVTLISSSAVVMSTMELRMANNVEGTTRSFQTSMAAVDYVLADPANLPSSGPLNVPTSVTLTGSPFVVSGSDVVAADATRVEDCAAPPRMTNATSMKAYSSFRYEISATVDVSAGGMGRGGMVQGYLRLGPKC